VYKVYPVHREIKVSKDHKVIWDLKVTKVYKDTLVHREIKAIRVHKVTKV
jgi:hypothetical protein